MAEIKSKSLKMNEKILKIKKNMKIILKPQEKGKKWRKNG